MNSESFIIELTSLLDLIDEIRGKINAEHDKFQVALTNTLRLLDGKNPTLAKMKGNEEDLKAFLIKSSMNPRQTSLESLDQLRSKVEKLRDSFHPQ
jgi:hypothetical protein